MTDYNAQAAVSHADSTDGITFALLAINDKLKRIAEALEKDNNGS